MNQQLFVLCPNFLLNNLISYYILVLVMLPIIDYWKANPEHKAGFMYVLQNTILIRFNFQWFSLAPLLKQNHHIGQMNDQYGKVQISNHIKFITSSLLWPCKTMYRHQHWHLYTDQLLFLLTFANGNCSSRSK